MSDSASMEKAIQGYLTDVKDPATGTNVVNPKQMANRATRRRVFRYTKAVDAGTGTPVAEVPVMNPQVAITVQKITFTPDSTLATAGTNYMTVTIQGRTAASSFATTVALASMTTNTGGQAFTQWTPVTLLSTPTNLSAGDIVTYTNAKTGTGAALPGGVFEIEYDEAY